MTVQNPPWAIASQNQTPGSWRRMLDFLFNSRQGVVTGLTVTQRAAGANMSVDVSDGAAIINGKSSATQGFYFVDNLGVQNVPISPAHPTLARRDAIIATVVDDSFPGGGSGPPGFRLDTVDGTPAASPTYPSIIASSVGSAIVIAGVEVAAGATSITNANITNVQNGALGSYINRGWATGLGGRIASPSNAVPTANLRDGLERYEIDTGRIFTRDGSTWVNTGSTRAGLTWATTITQGSAVAHVASMARFERRGRWISGQMHLTVNGTGTLNSLVRVGVPEARGYAHNHAAGHGYVQDVSTGNFFPVIAYFDTASTLALMRSAADGTANVFLGTSGLTQLAAGDIISLAFGYEAAA
jgi:hypothetical protein